MVFYELTQVKFTVDPDAPDNRLSWKWLTENSGVLKKSLLQKWAATTLHHKSAGTLAWAALKTDRVPDAEFGECLKGSKVAYSKLSAEIKAKIEDQLGSHEDAESFFKSFDFVHSKPKLDDLEEELWNRIASDTDRGGWCQFLYYVRRWSTRQGQPCFDGKIKYIHLRQVFSVERSKPISQDFRVPRTYSVPDEKFDKDFLEKIAGSDGNTVLWGPPGRGKSTYLSHCVALIKRKSAVCIRHHYFLSLRDRSEGRFHYHAIARSLEHQLEKAIPDLNIKPRENLGELLNKAARRLQSEDRRLIVIIDGLDHVWREHRDHEEMEALFDALLPLPPNVRLVVGTQKIASKHLPARLLNILPAERWTELPLMSPMAVQRWLRFQDEDGRLNLKVAEWQERDHVIRAVAQALHDISNGLPLHLIYSFREIAQTGNAVTAEDVAALPACPTGDIHDYYRSFLERTDAKAQAVLHVLAGLEFGPPPFAMHDCFGRSDESFAAFAAINHLVDYQETEVRPFHGSLFAFVRDLSGHRNIFLAHASDVLDWLETRAPEYWRWAWLWITKAQLGDSSDLFAGPSREWAIDALVAGYPIEQITAILDHTEKVAFDAFDLPRLLSLRSLKERTIDGPEFQTDEWSLFREVGVSLSSDPSVAAILRSELHTAPSGLIPFMVASSEGPLREKLAQDAIDELYQRASRYDLEKDSYNDQSELVHAIVAVTANTKTDNFKRVKALATKNAHAADALMSTYARASLLASNYGNVFAVGKRYTCSELDRDVLAALCLEGLAPAAKPELKTLTHPAIRCLALLKGGATKRSRTKRDISRLFIGGDGPDARFAEDTCAVVYEAFFAALAAELSGGNAQGWSKIPSDAQLTWLGEAVRVLEQLAGDIAERWLASQQWPSLQEVYRTFENCQPLSDSFTVRRRFNAVRLAFRDIAVDLCTIARNLDANAFIDAGDIESASMSPFWLNELWLDAFSERRLPLHTPEAAQTFATCVGSEFDTKITEFNERATTAIKLAKFASDNGLVALAKKELRRAVGCLLGYGWRKDMFASEVIESLSLLAEWGDEESRNIILKLAGEFEAITLYTDGDHTDYIREKYYEAITAHFPERMPACYAHLIRKEEWRYAEAIATAVIETNQVDSRKGLALLESYIDPGEILALENTGSVSCPYVDAALTAVRRKTGRAIRGTPEHEEPQDTEYLNSNNYDSSLSETEVTVPDPCDFPPGRLHGYLNEVRDMRDYRDQRGLVGVWLRCWEAAGRADKALTDLEAAVSDTKLFFGHDNALDVAFQIALRAQGRSKAYLWLIRSHIRNWGWQRRLSEDNEAHARMRMVAAHYPGRWREFIKKTAKPRYAVHAARNGIIIGQSRLVLFLIEAGELKLARNCALEMARIFTAELKEQPIETPEWAK